MEITYDLLRHSEEINTYIRQADASLEALGFTEHSFAHVAKCAKQAADLLAELGYPARTAELARIAGYLHDIGNVVNRVDHALAAALILADKSDVRRSRVRSKDTIAFDIHDRVNYAVERSALKLDKEAKTITLELEIDSSICPILEYFEIFMTRMLLCRKAAAFFDLRFGIVINGQIMM